MTRSEAIKILSAIDVKNGCLIDITGGQEVLDFTVKELQRIAELEDEIAMMKNLLSMREEERAGMQGMIDGLKFAIRCNGVSGSEV